jgi:hypothetical protein
MRSRLLLLPVFLSVACTVHGYFVLPDADDSISWLKHISGNGAESVSAVAFASDGSLLITGLFEQTIDLGGGPLTASNVDLFIAKFGPGGEHVWSKRWPGFGDFLPEGWDVKLGTLSNGDFVLAGDYTGALTLGSTTLVSVGAEDVFIARFSGEGEPIWARSGGSNVYDRIFDLSVDPNDNIDACGGTYGSGSFFGGSTLSGAPDWLARITGAGDYSWSRAMPAVGLGSICGVASMSDGDVVYAGSFAGSISAGGPTLTSNNGSVDICMARYGAADGGHRWSAAKGGSGEDVVGDVEASGSSVIITGVFNNMISFGGPSLTAQEGDAFVAKLDASNGAHQFSLAMGGPSGDGGRRVVVRPNGQITASGVFTGTANFGGILLSAPTAGAFAVDLDGVTGVVSSVRSVEGNAPIMDIATSAQSLAIGGYFYSSITALNQTLTSDGRIDGYVLVFKR